VFPSREMPGKASRDIEEERSPSGRESSPLPAKGIYNGKKWRGGPRRYLAKKWQNTGKRKVLFLSREASITERRKVEKRKSQYGGRRKTQEIPYGGKKTGKGGPV